MKPLSVIAQDLSVVRQSYALLDSVSFGLAEGQNLLITGLSGSGKTVLLQAMAGKVFYRGSLHFRSCEAAVHPKIVLVEQHYYFKNRSHTSNFYYQQRFNSADATDAETVLEVLQKQSAADLQQVQELVAAFGMELLKDAPLLQLSSGEHKRFQIIKAILSRPEVLLLDEPFMGLDIASRRFLKQVLNGLSQNGCTVILVCAVPDVPACITHVAELNKGRLQLWEEIESYKALKTLQEQKIPTLSFLPSQKPHFEMAVFMQNVNICYGKKQILRDVTWEVKSGSKWLLKGPNGAGKSTLISLITGDNPQAFANNIWLFDHKKGSGESIWDIKKQIGFLSPELQWHFDTGTTCRQAVASGLFDTIGLFRKLSLQQEEDVQYWLTIFDLDASANQLLRNLPFSQQKLVLLARAMVKNPAMLILDEPCQGLDEQQKLYFLQIMEALCIKERTLIYVSHYASEVPDCIEQVIELNNGEATIYKHHPHTQNTLLPG